MNINKILNRQKDKIKTVFCFFPIKLFFLHIKGNFLLLSFWFILFLTISSLFGDSLGIPNLFLAPEHNYHVNALSFSFMGLFTGAFIVAFNISSYELNSHKFPFLASLGRPFTKYMLNNFLVPLIYLFTYTYYSYQAQQNFEMLEITQIVINLLFFWLSVFAFIFFSILFFYLNNRKLRRRIKIKKFKETKLHKPINQLLEKEKKWRNRNRPEENIGEYRVDTYLYSVFKVRRARGFEHYSEEVLNKIYEKTLRNASLFAVLILFFILLSNLLTTYIDLSIPAGASVILTFTAILLVFSAIHSFFKSWSFFVFITLIFIINSFSYLFDAYNFNAYGLDYSKQSEACELNLKFNSKDYFDSYGKTIDILENWKAKNSTNTKKPPLIIINASGGGMKLSFWTYLALSRADSALNGKLFENTFLITGSSGGMIGASYLRELYYQKKLGKIEHYYHDSLLRNLSNDLLNPIMFKLATSDWFIHLNKFKYNNKKYYIDRAHVFEKHLNLNTYNLLDKALCSYKEPEQKAIIPMIIISPTILNDGRQLLISPQDIDYLTEEGNNITENIEFRKAYKKFGADSLRFTTALRMSATFPYMSPLTILPGQPQLGIIDAGLRDNLGFGIALQFIHVFRTWLEQNTSEIIIVQLYEQKIIEQTGSFSLFDKFIKPAGSVYKNLFNMQRLNNLRMVGLINKELEQKIRIIPLSFIDKEGKVSLSWRLYKKEREILMDAINDKEFIRNVEKLRLLLN